MHVDLWSPGATDDAEEGNIHLLNSMCDLSQLIISSITTSIEAHILAQIFISKVVMTFGICSVVVIDGGNPFIPQIKLLVGVSIRTTLWNSTIAF